MSCEDEDTFKRLLALGARGSYRPDLIVHHYVAPERVAKGYFRRWCFWRGVSLGMLDRQQPQDVAYLLGVPRYLYGRAVASRSAKSREVWSEGSIRPDGSKTSLPGGTSSASFGADTGWGCDRHHRPRAACQRQTNEN